MPINYAVLNGIAQHLGWDERMPEITKENFYNLGQTLNQDDTNAFLGMLSKISEQFVYSTKYNADDNPFQPFFKSDVPVGEFIERTFVGVIDGSTPTYNDNGAVSLSRKIPPVSSSYNSFNFEKEYGITVSDAQARSAFLNITNMNQVLSQITSVLPNSANLDLYLACKELCSKAYLNNSYYSTGLAAPTSKENSDNLIQTIKDLVFNFSRPSQKYNKDGVINKSFNDDIFVLVRPSVFNAMGVKSLSAAFNISEVEIRDKILVIDEEQPFGSIMDGTLALCVDRNFFNIHKQIMNSNSILVPVGGGYYNVFMYLKYAFTYYNAYNAARIYDNTSEYTIRVNGVTTDKTSATEGTVINISAPTSGNVYIVYTDTVTGEDSAYITLDVTSTKSFVMPGNNISVTTTEPDIKSTTDII